MASIARTIAILGTGGTAAGTAPGATDNVGYSPLVILSLLVAVSPLAALPIEAGRWPSSTATT